MKTFKFYKVDANVTTSNDSITLHWGDFYYRSKKKARERMIKLMCEVADWVKSNNTQSNEAQPTNIIDIGDTISFEMVCWDGKQKVSAVISVVELAFQDDQV